MGGSSYYRSTYCGTPRPIALDRARDRARSERSFGATTKAQARALRRSTPASRAGVEDCPSSATCRRRGDGRHDVYVPLEDGSRAGDDGVTTAAPAVARRADRETGATRWTRHHRQPSASGVDARRGCSGYAHGNRGGRSAGRSTPMECRARPGRCGRRWSLSGIAAAGVLEGDELVAIHLDASRGRLAPLDWRIRSTGRDGRCGSSLCRDQAGRVMRVSLRRVTSSGSVPWPGELSEPTIDRRSPVRRVERQSRLAVVARRAHR